MINLIHRCMTESELSHKKWDNHLALFHLKEFANAKEVYLNGKPLKWYHIFKKGDLIEVIDRPHDLFTMIGAALFGSIFFGASTTTFTVLGVLAVAGIVGTVATIGTAIFNSLNRGSATTQNKEYSSATQPELRGASNDISNDIVPVTFGTIQQTPSYAQTPYRLVQDGTGKNKYHQYFIANYDNVVYSDYKLGETPITNYLDTYYDINTAYGSSTFIGYDNCKALSIDEELSYDKDAQINHGGWLTIGTALNTSKVTSETISLSICFDADNTATFDTSKFTSKTYSVEFTCNNTTQTRNFTISSVGYVPADGHLYPVGSNPSVSFSITVPASPSAANVYSIRVTSTNETRQNSYEVLHELSATLEFVSITVGSYSKTYDIDQNFSEYNIVPSEIIQTSPPNTTDIDVIISFPQGLYKINSNSGNRLSRSAALAIQYKGINENSWHELDEATSIYIRDIDNVKQPLSNSTTTYSDGIITIYSPDDIKIADQLFFRPIGFELPAGQYNVRVRCADFKDKTNYDVGVPHCSEIQFRCTGDVVNPIVLPKTTQLAFEVTAYKNLSGTLKKFNYIVENYIPCWNGQSQWNYITISSNPAAVVRYLLTDDKVNPRAESVSHIDNDSLVEYYNWCEEQGYKADGVISEACKIGEVVNEILKNTQCAMIPLYNGKHTFVIDKPNKTPVGLFNQHNSWNFKWIPNIGRQTEAIRASFVEDDDWTQDELTLYWYDGAVHDEPKAGTSDLDYEMVKKDYKYVSDRASVRKIVAYELETIQTKRNQFEFDVNLEAMNMMLLDRIYISNTANMQNESTGLIKATITENGYLNGFELYSPVNIPQNAKIVIRSLDYNNHKPIITIYDVTNSGESSTVNINPVWIGTSINAYSIRGAGEITGLEDTWYYDGDLFTLGQDTIYDCTVTDIKYNDDGTATITARDYGFNNSST